MVGSRIEKGEEELCACREGGSGAGKDPHNLSRHAKAKETKGASACKESEAGGDRNRDQVREVEGGCNLRSLQMDAIDIMGREVVKETLVVSCSVMGPGVRTVFVHRCNANFVIRIIWWKNKLLENGAKTFGSFSSCDSSTEFTFSAAESTACL